MKVFDMVVAERLHAADLLESLTPAQLRQPSLCDAWTVHEVGGHLTSFLRFGQLKIYYGIAAYAADFDRLNIALTRRHASRPTAEIVALLRRRATSRVTIPRSGYDPVLTDLVLHDLDIRVPLGIARAIPQDRLRVAFAHLAAMPSPGFNMRARLRELRLVATDTGWTYGTGPEVRGPAESLLLAMGGRRVAFDQLTGDGAALLRERVVSAVPSGPLRRLSAPLRVLLRPPPRERRARAAVGPDAVED